MWYRLRAAGSRFAGLTLSLSRGRLSNRCKAGSKSGGSHYFGLGHFRSGGRLESHPVFGQIPDGFAHSFSFPELMV